MPVVTNHQYEAPILPTSWTGDEKKFYTRLIDVLDEIYSKYGRLSLKDLSPAVRKQLSELVDNTTFQTIIEQTEREIRLKADASTVDALGQTVSSHSTQIQQNASAIALKASQSSVDSLTGRVSSAETSLTLKADQATLTSTANGLQSQIDAVPGKISLAINNVQVGGTNLIRYSKEVRAGSGSDLWNLSTNVSTYADADLGYTIIWINQSGATSNVWRRAESPVINLGADWVGKQVTISGWVYSPNYTAIDSATFIGLYFSQGAKSRLNWVEKTLTIGNTNQWGPEIVSDAAAPVNGKIHRFSITITLDASIFSGTGVFADNTVMWAVFTAARNADLRFYGLKAEWGNKATAWSPAPEDTDAAINNVNTQLSLVPGQITAAVSGTRVIGRNLLRGTAELACTNTLFSSTMYLPATQAWPLWEPAFVATRTSEGIRGTTDANKMSGFVIPLAYEGAVAGGETYTLSFTYKTNLSTFGTPYIMCRVGGNVSAASISPPVSTTEWANFSTQITWPSTANKFPYAILIPYVKASGGWLELKDRSVKLEKGTKATAWSAAPEDNLNVHNLLMGTDTPAVAAFNAASTFGVTLPYLTDGRKTFAEMGLKAGDYITIAFRWVISNATTYGNFRAEMYGRNGTGHSFIGAIKNPVATFSSSHWFGDEVIVYQLTADTVNGIGVAFRIDNSVLTFTIEHMTIVPGQVMSGDAQSSGELINTSMTLNDKGIFMGTTGTFQLNAENPNQDAFINIKGLFTADNVGGLTAERGTFANALTVGGQRVLTLSDIGIPIKVSTSQPTGHGFVWLQPSSVTSVRYTGYTADSRNSTVMFSTSQRTITRSFAAEASNTLANGTFTYTLTFEVMSLSDAQLTGVTFSATATKGSTVSFSASSAITLTKYQTATITLTATSSTNLASNANAISVAITATASSYGGLYLNSKQWMTLTIAKSGGSGTQGCNVYYIP